MTEVQLRTYAVTLIGPAVLFVWSFVHAWH